MAPAKEKAKEKTKRASGDDATDMILQYLRKQNRPYSATDISANLHNQVTKAAAAKILKDLHERQQIEGRAAGKQLVYHTIQDPTEAISAEQLAEQDAKIDALREETVALKVQAAGLRSQLSTLNATMSTADLREAVARLEKEKESVLGRLEKLRKGGVKPTSEEEKGVLEAEVRRWTSVEKKRRAIHRDMWNLCKDSLQGQEKNIEDLQEELGITDV